MQQSMQQKRTLLTYCPGISVGAAAVCGLPRWSCVRLSLVVIDGSCIIICQARFGGLLSLRNPTGLRAFLRIWLVAWGMHCAQGWARHGAGRMQPRGERGLHASHGG